LLHLSLSDELRRFVLGW